MERREDRKGELGEWVAATLAETDGIKGNLIATWRLSEVSARPPLRCYIQQLWARRFFIMADARAKAFLTSRGTVLGKAWLVVKPFLDALVYFVIFGLLLRTSRGIDNFPAYLVVGMNIFGLVQSGLASGDRILIAGKNLIRAFSFPRASLVFSWAIRTVLDFLPVCLATLFFILLVPPGVTLSWRWILVAPVIFLSALFSLGSALIVSSVTFRLPDLKFIWPLFGRFWFYGSGIFFSVDTFSAHPVAQTVIIANPGYQFISAARSLLVYQELPTFEQWGYLSVWSIGLFVLGFVMFWSHEECYGREL